MGKKIGWKGTVIGQNNQSGKSLLKDEEGEITENTTDENVKLGFYFTTFYHNVIIIMMCSNEGFIEMYGHYNPFLG